MIQKTVIKLIMLSIIVFMLQACNSELDYSEDNLITDAQKRASELTEKEFSKYNKVYYLPSSNAKGDQTEKFQSIVNGMNRSDALIINGTHYISSTIVLRTAGVTFLGESNATIKLASRTQVTLVHVESSAYGLVIKNIIFDGTGGRKNTGNGVHSDACMFVKSHCNYIENCTFKNAGNGGLMFHGSSSNFIKDCEFHNNYIAGLSQWYSKYNTIDNCNSHHNGAEGITIDAESHYTTIRDCRITNNNKELRPNGDHRGIGGIGIDASDSMNIYHNKIKYNGLDGIKIHNWLCNGSSSNVSIHHNRVIGNQDAALGIRENGQNAVTFNNVAGNYMSANGYNGVDYYDNNQPCLPYNASGPIWP